MTLGELATELGAELRGDPQYRVVGMATLQAAGPEHLAFLANPRYKPSLLETRAGAVMLRADDAEGYAGQVLILSDPYLAFARLTHRFDRTPRPAAGIHASAVVAASAVVPATACIGPLAVIGEGVVLGERVVIESGAVIQDGARVGDDSRIRSRAVIHHDCILGARVSIGAGAIIGGDGFGFAQAGGRWHKIAQIGRVVIHDNVDVGANTTIDRGALDDTVIHAGVIIDNQVQIAHNVVIGEHTAIAACCGIAGSTRIGARCILGGAVGVVGHIEICDDVQLTAMAMITRSISQPGSYSSGTGFESTDNWRRMVARLRHLDELAKRVRALGNAANKS
ncbi:MAG: UDP-3-O-(3-hydroxymyristoyl)glucosamine N-acyltransferase [Perlucidibaca sp.]